MLNSMTGFGCSKAEFDFGTVEINIQSVNHRYFNVRSYLPERFQKYQLQIEKELKARLSRGSVTIYIKVKSAEAKQDIKFDKALVIFYLTQISEIIKSVNPDPENFLISQQGNMHGYVPDGTIHVEPKISAGELFNLPGVVIQNEENNDINDEIFQQIVQTLNIALDELIKMRSDEGKTITDEFLKRLEFISKNLEIIDTRRIDIFSNQYQKLLSRVNEILAKQNFKVEENDIAREIALAAERSDISEEISRLKHHINQFKRTLAEEVQIGHKLDFITQEMLREANTIASKSSSAEINTLVVEIKAEIDKIKEQVQNVQ